MLKIRVRNLNEGQVMMAIRDPDSSYEDTESNAQVAVKRINTRNLVVVYSVKAEKTKIITVYHASDVGKLIRRKLQRGAWLVRR